MDKRKTFESYEAPQVEALEVEVEMGFASSNELTGNEAWEENN